MTRILSKQRRRLGPSFLWWAFFAGIAIAASPVFLGPQVNRGCGETQALRAEAIRSCEDRASVIMTDGDGLVRGLSRGG